jgi:hypothetical protein
MSRTNQGHAEVRQEHDRDQRVIPDEERAAMTTRGLELEAEARRGARASKNEAGGNVRRYRCHPVWFHE